MPIPLTNARILGPTMLAAVCSLVDAVFGGSERMPRPPIQAHLPYAVTGVPL